MIYLIGIVYVIGILGAIFLIRKKSYYAIPVIVGVIGLDLVLGGTALHSHLASLSAEYSGMSYIGLSVFIFLILIVL
ncbi:hypothetical protein JOC77_001472 [Peribacillus deserti]|uniref:Uncharacterized protein n=1 Tax=Peribacillus deserti TaxID=673318 RepID=A0ABS2QFW5_9BACI|nr:hypothetical protein [Peribacillus deserti]MBM7692045.1 hypothetical protein [Peribacillus deserti]